MYRLVHQTTPSAVLDALHHQHLEGGSGHSGRAFVTQRNVYTVGLVLIA